MANETAHAGPYVDQSITKRNVDNEAAGLTVPTPVPARSGATTLGETKIYETVDQAGASLVNHEPGDQGAQAIPHSPNSWAIEDDADGFPRSRDPYRNNGMTGQDFFDNQG